MARRSLRSVATACALVATMFLTLGGLTGEAAAQNAPEQVLYNFCSLVEQNTGCLDGLHPLGNLVFDGAGNLYGVTFEGGATAVGGSSGFGSVFKLTPTGSTWTHTIIHSFCNTALSGQCPEGAASLPQAGPIVDAAGNLYGTTTSPDGSVYKLTPNGSGGYNYANIYFFCQTLQGNVCIDGADPLAPVIQDGNGVLYGTTSTGGANNGGAVFSLTPNGQGGYTYAKIYDFCSQPNCTDGSTPMAGLLRDASGNLFGTTSHGGNSANQQGTVFELSRNGGGYSFSVLHTFCLLSNCTDGATPVAGLIADNNGNFYGTASSGGSGAFAPGNGVIFQLTPNGDGTYAYSVSYNFCQQTNCTDGGEPEASLIRDAAGNLYGTTATRGGGSQQGGVVFELDSGKNYTVLYNFCSLSNCSDGDQPGQGAGVLMDSAGNLFGTTEFGGTGPGPEGFGAGTLFALGTRPHLLYAKQADFNGDGFADLLWRFTDGTTAIWEMNGANPSATPIVGAPDNTWTIAGTGDFSGTGDTGLLWRHNDGAVAIWLLSGGQVVSAAGLGVVSTDWQIIGTGNFFGGNKAAILWRYKDGTVAAWQMNGTSVVQTPIVGSIDNTWQIAGVGDFFNTGTTSLLWRRNDGAVALWELSNGQVIGGFGIGTVTTDWQIAGTGNFFGPGSAGILWRYKDGTLAAWQMNGANVQQTPILGSVDNSWQIAGVGDFFKTGTSSLVWRHNDGAVAIWELSNGQVSNSFGLGTITTQWSLLE